MPATIITGLQWGDEGKGKMVDHLAAGADVVARFSGGANAGHTVEAAGLRIALHQLPSGLLHPGVLGVIGASCVVDPVALSEEVSQLEAAGVSIAGRLAVSSSAHLVHPAARLTEKWSEKSRGGDSVGTTGRGIGPTYVRKYQRKGIRLEDAAFPDRFRERSAAFVEECASSPGATSEEIAALRTEEEAFIRESLRLVDRAGDVSLLLNDLLDRDGVLIAEGAQGSLLDPDHGTYPFVTCGPCLAGGACLSLGIGPTRIDEVVGVMKAYSTRVGNGPFPTELIDATGERIRKQGNEYGATTGRPRRCGWFDAVLASYTARLNGCTWIALTLLDVLSGLPELQVCRRYELDPEIDLTLFETGARLQYHVPVYEKLPGWDENILGAREWDALPENARSYVEYLEELVGVPIRAVSTGPRREDILWRTK
jgi:adenylosuccinate synthase